MPALVHATIASAYVALAGLMAFGVPAFARGVNAGMAQLSAGIALVACALLHEAVARHLAARRLGRELDRHRSQQAKVMGELSRSRAELSQLHDALEAAFAKRAGTDVSGIERVMREVTVLRRLVDRISGDRPEFSGARYVNGHVADPVRIEAAPTPDLDDDAILAAVREALAADRVDLYLQPIVSLPQRRRRYFECYSRIRTAAGDVLLASQYLEMAAREGLIAAIDNLLLLRCVQLVRKTQKRHFDVGFFCHVSPHTLEDETFLGEFVEFVLANGDLADHLFLEFAQADLEGRSPEVRSQLDRLGKAGFRYSVDQVASLEIEPAALKALHVGFLKVGARAVLDAAEQGSVLARIKAGLGRAGIELIVEKIESEPMLLDLLDHDIDFGQGYLFGMPRPSREG